MAEGDGTLQKKHRVEQGKEEQEQGWEVGCNFMQGDQAGLTEKVKSEQGLEGGRQSSKYLEQERTAGAKVLRWAPAGMVQSQRETSKVKHSEKRAGKKDRATNTSENRLHRALGMVRTLAFVRYN